MRAWGWCAFEGMPALAAAAVSFEAIAAVGIAFEALLVPVGLNLNT